MSRENELRDLVRRGDAQSIREMFGAPPYTDAQRAVVNAAKASDRRRKLNKRGMAKCLSPAEPDHAEATEIAEKAGALKAKVDAGYAAIDERAV